MSYFLGNTLGTLQMYFIDERVGLVIHWLGRYMDVTTSASVNK